MPAAPDNEASVNRHLRLLPTPEPRPDLLDLVHAFARDHEDRLLQPRQHPQHPAPADRTPPEVA